MTFAVSRLVPRPGTSTSLRLRPALLVLRAWWGRILGIYVVSRLLSTVLVASVLGAADQTAAGNGRGLLGTLMSWDGAWYAEIGANGYPTALPIVGGQVANNAWAFRPLYALLVKGASFGQPVLWPWAAVTLSAIFGAGAALMLGALVRRRLGDRAAVVAAALFSLGPTSFILQTGYAESLGLLLAFAFLYCVETHRFGRAGLVALAFTFTREGVAAMAVVAAARLVVLVRSRVRLGQRPTRREVVGVTGLVAATSGLTGLWPAIAWAATGVPDAYARTVLSWRVGYGFDPAAFTVFVPWLRGAELWFGNPVGYIVLANVLLVGVGVLFVPIARRLGPVILTWYVAFGLFLLASFFPQSSTLRASMPLAPILGILGGLRRTHLAVLLFFCVSVQALMIWNAYAAPYSIVSTP